MRALRIKGLTAGLIIPFVAGLLVVSGAIEAASAAVSAVPSAVNETVEIKDGATKFLAVGRPSALKINGEGAAPQGTIKIASGQVTGALSMDLTTFKTGIETRDRHMKEKYFEVGKAENQKAVLTIVECPVPAAFFAGDKGNATALAFKGKLKLHSVEKDVTGTVSLTREGKSIKGDSSFEVKISEYGIALPSFAGITVAEDVKIQVALAGTEQSVAAAATAKGAGGSDK